MEERKSKEGGEYEGGRVSCALKQTDKAQRKIEKNERFRKRLDGERREERPWCSVGDEAGERAWGKDSERQNKDSLRSIEQGQREDWGERGR